MVFIGLYRFCCSVRKKFAMTIAVTIEQKFFLKLSGLLATILVLCCVFTFYVSDLVFEGQNR